MQVCVLIIKINFRAPSLQNREDGSEIINNDEFIFEKCVGVPYLEIL